MPVILLSGFPCSGKSTRAQEITAEFRKRAPEKKVYLVSDESVEISKSTYKDSKNEKLARANLMSAIKRNLNKDNIVIVDGLNYIKGYRYQIFCEAKSEQTTYAVVHVGTPPEVCRDWNSQRLEGPGRWDNELMDALIFRYEEPNGMNRWDSPLYFLSYSDELSVIMPGLFDSIMHGKPKPPNFATLLKPAAGSDYIYELDRNTQEVVKLIMERQKETGCGGLEIPVGQRSEKIKTPVEVLSTAQLQRLRRTFVSLNKVRQIDHDRIKASFIEYLNRNFGSE
ncbi:chromatin associated protein KTI12 [Lipomyces oligophaga]|uniref:chromatin associated protein KTI12 n=1 Tax=Lipomyces oligophaga TaxID=45792 RepID=UPI0034CD946F